MPAGVSSGGGFGASRARTRLPHLYMGGAEVIPVVAAE